ncbi:unnamed protein product [Didymodactylos carnosus]|uniref:Uncharacterized protein n=1 Tax=Didymodactylos carnosus TaxID=1234261 RepID=A0A813VJB4_9BILA|nr:unnamed protein product [Didymodactylos carnosus]CAF0843988.1 unnamed protein product [Didymodactylos carnosus]CAF3512953.1 unnamed protein product [Didymodactylos carnosus]CAF3631400.1 unnamed protein product [Didymodactylos carnosus]
MSVLPTYRSNSTTFARQSVVITSASDKNHMKTCFTAPIPPLPRLINHSSATQDCRSQLHNSQTPLTTSLSSIPSNGSISKQRSVTSSEAYLQSTNNVEAEEEKNPKLYVHSNPPRVLHHAQQQQSKYLSSRTRIRVSSAPEENSPRLSPPSSAPSQKPSSANANVQQQQQQKGNTTVFSYHRQKISATKTEENHFYSDNQEQLSTTHRYHLVEVDKKHQQAELSQQTRSKVPVAVQKRRMLILLPPKPVLNSHLSLTQQDEKEHLLTMPNTCNIGDSSNMIKKSTQSSNLGLHIEQKLLLAQKPLVNTNTVSNLKSSSTSSKIQPASFEINQNEKHTLEEQQQKMNNVGEFELESKALFMDSDGMDAMLNYINRSDGDEQEQLINIDPLLETTPKPENQMQSPRRQQTKRSNLTKYEYTVVNSLDNTTTLRVSPGSSLRPYRDEMAILRSNTKASQLLSSIVTDCGSQSDNSGSPLENEQDDDEEEQVALCYDEILSCYYDPNTQIYYELQSA